MWGALRRFAPSISSPQAYRAQPNITKRTCLTARIALLRDLQTCALYVSRPPHGCLRLSLLRSLSQGAGSQDLDVTTDDETRKEKTKKKRQTRKKKSSNKTCPSKPPEAHHLELTFPFEGTLDKQELSHTPETLAALQNSDKSGNTFTVHIGNATDGSDARMYCIHKNDETFRLPSVTTILSQTLSKQRGFMLSNWRKGLVKEVGKDGYQQARNQILAVGNRFHEELQSRLHRPHVLSIKPQNSLTRTPILTSSSHTSPYSPIPPPLSFPPNHYNTFPRTSMNTVDNIPYDVIVEERDEGALEVVENDKDFSSDATSSKIPAEKGVGTSPSKCDESSTGYLESVQHVLSDISEVYALESVVAHLELGYSGTCDCIATYKGSTCLVDWKTSSKPRPLISDLYDYPLQAVAYAGAVNMDPHYPFKVENVLIVVTYPSGEPGHAHFLPRPLCQEYWSQWLVRLLHYQTQFASDLGDMCV